MSKAINLSNDSPKMLPPKKASKYLGVSEYYLRKGIEENTIPYFKSGNRVYILIDALIKQLENEAQKQINYCWGCLYE